MTIRLPITVALAALAFAFPVSTDALGANVVPNPGFEQGGCGASTPVICGWQGSYVSQAGSPGSYYLSLSCGPLGCYAGGGLTTVSASTDRSFCAAIGPGHPPGIVLDADRVAGGVGRDLLSGGGLHRAGWFRFVRRLAQQRGVAAVHGRSGRAGGDAVGLVRPQRRRGVR